MYMYGHLFDTTVRHREEIFSQIPEAGTHSFFQGNSSEFCDDLFKLPRFRIQTAHSGYTAAARPHTLLLLARPGPLPRESLRLWKRALPRLSSTSRRGPMLESVWGFVWGMEIVWCGIGGLGIAGDGREWRVRAGFNHANDHRFGPTISL